MKGVAVRSQNFFDRLTVAVALILTVVLALALPLLPKKDFSAKERRALVPFPSVTADTLLDGRFFSDLSEYYADHFPLRESFTALKTAAERALGKRENNGILFGKDGYLIARGEYEDLAVAEQNLRAIRTLADRASVPVTVAVLPRATDVLTAYLPRGYDTTRASQIHEAIADTLPENTDLTAPLREAADAGESVFYRTDHHWTTDGAYLAYTQLAPTLGITPYEREDFTRVALTNEFLGTSFAKSGLANTTPDTIIGYRYEGDDSYTVTNAETGTCTHTLYDMTALSGDDPYAVFLGGNYARLEITDEAAPDKPTLLLFKDSFANALIPFLARHFALVVIDPRYETRSAAALIDEIAPDRILILFGADTVATTPSLARLGR